MNLYYELLGQPVLQQNITDFPIRCIMMSMWYRQRGFVILSLTDIHISIYLPKAGAELRR